MAASIGSWLDLPMSLPVQGKWPQLSSLFQYELPSESSALPSCTPPDYQSQCAVLHSKAHRELVEADAPPVPDHSGSLGSSDPETSFLPEPFLHGSNSGCKMPIPFVSPEGRNGIVSSHSALKFPF